jgi:hypothetical protein
MRLAALALTILSPLSLALAESVDNDFDLDNESDILTVSTTSGLAWKSVPSSDADGAIDTTFGLSDDLPTPGFWTSALSPSIAYVRTDITNNTLLWKVYLGDGRVRSVQFGKPGDYIIAGGDFNGNGIADGAIATSGKGGVLTWQVRYDLLSSKPGKTKTFKLGGQGSRITFVNIDGSRDRAAVFGLGKDKKKGELIVRDVMTGKQTSYATFPKSLTTGSRPRPVPIVNPEGKDDLLFVTSDATDTTLKVYTFSGNSCQHRSTIEVTGIGDIVVGEFSSSPTLTGYEVLLNTDYDLKTINPFVRRSSSATVLTNTPVDGFVVTKSEDVGIPEPTATPTPTPNP